MIRRITIPLILFLIAAVLMGAIIFYKSIQPKFSEFTLITPNGLQENIGTPMFLDSMGVGNYTLQGVINVSALGSRVFRVIPDDRLDFLSINGESIDLSVIPSHQLKDYSKGFQYDLSNYLVGGDNVVVAKYYDRGGKMGVVFTAELSGGHATFTLVLGFVLFAVIFWLWVKKVKLAGPAVIIFFLALAMRLFYLSQTGVDERGHDMGDHIAYTKYFAENWRLPPVEYSVGGAFFHPPLSYFVSAIAYSLTRVVEPSNNMVLFKVQQFFCLLCATGFLLYGLLILQHIFLRNEDLDDDRRKIWQWYGWLKGGLNRQVFILCAALFSFWPSAIIHSARIGNDPLLYSLFAASLYYILRWYRSEKNSDLIIASIIAAAATLTKANGEILIAVLGLLGFAKMLKSKEWIYYLKKSVIPLLIVVPAVALTVGPALILKMEGKRDKLYIDNLDGISTANLVGNTAANYLWFDTKTFITEPFTDPYDDRYGRQYFWNYLAKTGLIGEFKYKYPLGVNFAIALSFLAVLMFIYVLAGLYLLPMRTLIELAPIFLAGFLLWGGVTYMRMTFPANIDFRYIVPILITICSLFGLSIMQFDRIGAARAVRLGQAIGGAFFIASVIFILGVD